jgi:hypothetical protein
MDSEIGAPVGHRDLELLDEKTLAADVGERRVDDPSPCVVIPRRLTSHCG